MNKENILEIDNLERSYSTVMPDGETKVYSVLRGISFQVKRGEFIGIMGSSGCGKTTLLKTIGMLNKPNGGRVLYMVKIQQKFMGIIWQKYAGHNWHLYFKIFI